MVFSIDSSNKEIKNKYPVKSEDGNNDDSYRGYSMDIGYFDNDSYEGAHIFSLFIYLFFDIRSSTNGGSDSFFCRGGKKS